MTNKQKQNLLQFLGLYDGAIDGIWGPKSQTAMGKVREKYEGMDDAETLLLAVSNWEPNVAENNVGNNTGDWWDEIEGFDREEFRCTCGGRGCTGFPAEPHEQLVRNLADTRKHFGKYVDISSGVRCDLRNSELPGSAANSLHKIGKASDFRVRGQHSSVTLAYIRTLPHVDEAYAIDDSYVHMGVLKYD